MNASPQVQPNDIRRLLDRLLVEVGVSEESLRDGARITEDLALESVAFVELQVALEEELGIELDPIKVVELDELSAITEYLHGLALGR